jgi:hypothetical protein
VGYDEARHPERTVVAPRPDADLEVGAAHHHRADPIGGVHGCEHVGVIGVHRIGENPLV